MVAEVISTVRYETDRSELCFELETDVLISSQISLWIKLS